MYSFINEAYIHKSSQIQNVFIIVKVMVCIINVTKLHDRICILHIPY